ncbi:hypothetical protein ACWD6R_18190 [Streptomyces sp. NPDC005151]
MRAGPDGASAVALRREGFRSADPVWWNGAGGPYERLRGAEPAALLGEYEAHGRAHLVSSGDGGQHG